MKCIISSFLKSVFFKNTSSIEGQPYPEPLMPKLTYCYAVQLSIPSPRLPVVERVIENEVAQLRYKGDTLKMNVEHFWKLVSVFCVMHDFKKYSVSMEAKWLKVIG